MTSHFLPVTTERLTLRPFERGDIDALSSYHALPSVQRYVVKPCRDARDVADALGIMRGQVSLQRPGDTITLAMVARGDQQLLGQVSLNWSDATAGQGEVRFIINPTFSGQGYVEEALGAMFNLAFEHFRIHRVFARCDGRNHHSIKLMQKLGMRLEAHYREHALFQGDWDDELHFAILDREWQRSAKVRDIRPPQRVA